VTVIDVRPVRFGAPVSSTLRQAAVADLAERYGGEGDATPVSAVEFDPPDGGFFVAWVGAEAVGCGGWRTYRPEERTAEIKRMYTRPEWRGKGVATAILRALEEAAKAAGHRRMILETGVRQPEAIALYERSGYARITKYGHYKDEADSVSYGRDLE
jgi:GNAT superfamily N-acetyltransferase